MGSHTNTFSIESAYWLPFYATGSVLGFSLLITPEDSSSMKDFSSAWVPLTVTMVAGLLESTLRNNGQLPFKIITVPTETSKNSSGGHIQSASSQSADASTDSHISGVAYTLSSLRLNRGNGGDGGDQPPSDPLHTYSSQYCPGCQSPCRLRPKSVTLSFQPEAIFELACENSHGIFPSEPPPPYSQGQYPEYEVSHSQTAQATSVHYGHRSATTSHQQIPGLPHAHHLPTYAEATDHAEATNQDPCVNSARPHVSFIREGMREGLLEDLEAANHVDFLYGHFIIEFDEMEDIKTLRTFSARAKALIRLLEKKYNGYDTDRERTSLINSFCQALDNNYQPFLKHCLKTELLDNAHADEPEKHFSHDEVCRLQQERWDELTEQSQNQR